MAPKPARKPGLYRKTQIGEKHGSMIWMTAEQARKLNEPRPKTHVVDSKIAKGEMVAFSERRNPQDMRRSVPLPSEPGRGPFTMMLSTPSGQLKPFILMTEHEYETMIRRTKVPEPKGKFRTTIRGKEYIAFPNRRINPK